MYLYKFKYQSIEILMSSNHIENIFMRPKKKRRSCQPVDHLLDAAQRRLSMSSECQGSELPVTGSRLEPLL